MEYTVSEYRDEHRDQVFGLHASLINAGRRVSASYLHWKYRENPFIPSPLFFVALHGETVVGMRGLFGSCWELGLPGGPVVLPHADDLIIHPEHRNRGLFLRINAATMNAARDQGFPAMVSLSGGTNTQELSLVTGWKEKGELEQVFRHPGGGPGAGAQPRSHPSLLRGGYTRFRRLAQSLGYAPGRPPSDRAVDRRLSSMVRARNRNIQPSREPDLAGMSALAETSASGRLRAVRNEAFLKWRLAKPDRKYRFLYWRDSTLRGYMVLAWSGRNLRRVTIVDHAVEDDQVFAALLAALRDSDGTELRLLASTLPPSHRHLTEEAGFLPDPSFQRDQRRRFLYHPLAPPEDLGGLQEGNDTFPDRWRLGLLDTMGA